MKNKLLSEIAPEFADEIHRSLITDGFADLANQVDSLQIVDVCRCDQPNCSTFYTAPKPDGAYPKHENIVIESKTGLVVLDISDAKIVCVEVLDRPDIKEKLGEMLAEMNGGKKSDA